MGTIKHDSWSNDKFTALRTDMLAGKWDEEGCKSCWFKETNGQKSRRNRWIDSELKYMGAENVYAQNLSVDRNTIKHLYKNFNNICNINSNITLMFTTTSTTNTDTTMTTTDTATTKTINYYYYDYYCYCND